jgi:hypothetical protein
MLHVVEEDRRLFVTPVAIRVLKDEHSIAQPRVELSASLRVRVILRDPKPPARSPRRRRWDCAHPARGEDLTLKPGGTFHFAAASSAASARLASSRNCTVRENPRCTCRRRATGGEEEGAHNAGEFHVDSRGKGIQLVRVHGSVLVRVEFVSDSGSQVTLGSAGHLTGRDISRGAGTSQGVRDISRGPGHLSRTAVNLTVGHAVTSGRTQ